MDSMILPVSAVEKIQGNEIKVYGVEKGKGDQQSYQEAARAIAARKLTVAKDIQAFTADTENKDMDAVLRRKYQENAYQTGAGNGLSSLEQRQQRLQFQKSIQASRARSIQAQAAYEATFI